MTSPASHRIHLRTGLMIAATFAVVVAGAILVAGLWRYRSPAMARRVEALIAHQLRSRCSLEEFAIVPLRGITCRSLTIERPLGHSTALALRAERVEIVYYWTGVLMRLPAILRLSAEAAAGRRSLGEAVGVASAPVPLSHAMASFSRSLAGCVLKQATLSGGAMQLIRNGSIVFSMSGLHVRAAIPPDAAAALALEAEAQSASAFSRWNAGKIAAIASINGSAIRLARLSGSVCGGRLLAYGGFDADRRRIDSLVMRASKLDMASVYRASGASQGALAGRGALELIFKPCALHPDSIRAEGEATIVDLKIRDLPIQNLLLTNLLLSSLAELSFEKVTSRVAIEDGAVFTTGLRARGDPLSLAANGWMSFAGRLDYTTTGTLTKGFVQSLPPIVRESLTPERSGGASFSCRIFGPVERPVVTFDRKHARRAVNNVLKSISQELQRFFR